MADTQTEQRIIKKYPNRRLYDTHTSRYITLNDIYQLVLNDIAFKVIDSKSEQDLSRSTLLQILAEQEQQDNSVLSSELMQKLIQFQADPQHHLLGRYIEHCLEQFSQNQAKIKSPMNSILGGSTQATLLQEVAKSGMQSWLKEQPTYNSTDEKEAELELDR